MDTGERLAAAAAQAIIRPLSVEQELGAITHLMLPQGISPPPPEAARYLRGVAEAARKLVRQSLIEASARGSAAAVLSSIDRTGAALAAAYEDQLEYQRRIDVAFARGLSAAECRKGCSFCCHLKVTATPLEVIRIAAIQDASQQSSVLATTEKIAGLAPLQRLARKIPCPLLIEGACSVYEVRPITCRALLSLSASICERQFEAGGTQGDPQVVPSLATPRLLSASLINGQIAALRDLGLASHPVELIAALAALAREPALFPRWLSREDVFARA